MQLRVLYFTGQLYPQSKDRGIHSEEISYSSPWVPSHNSFYNPLVTYGNPSHIDHIKRSNQFKHPNLAPEQEGLSLWSCIKGMKSNSQQITSKINKNIKRLMYTHYVSDTGELPLFNLHSHPGRQILFWKLKEEYLQV